MQTNEPTPMISRRRALRLMVTSAASLALLPAVSASAQVGRLTESVRLKHFNIERRSKLALDGYDPVSYHRKGGPVKGSKSRAVRYRGVIYRFANDSNKEAFKKSPSRYEPAYGGWCAWAMREGSKTDVDPKSYLVIDDQLYVFYKGVWGNTRSDWIKLAKKRGNSALIKQANSGWAEFVG